MMEPPDFQRRFRFGYDPEEVDAAFTGAQHEISRLRDELAGVRSEHAAVTSAPGDDAAPVALRRALFGVDRRQAEGLVARARRHAGRLQQVNDTLRQRLAGYRDELSTWRERQEAMERMALRASEEADAVRARARDEAGAMLRETRGAADRIIDEARLEARALLEAAEPQIAERRSRSRDLDTMWTQLHANVRGAIATFDRRLARLEPDAEQEPASGMVVRIHQPLVAEGSEELPQWPSAGDRQAAEHSAAQPSLRHRVRVGGVRDYAHLARVVGGLRALDDVSDVFVHDLRGDAAELTLHLQAADCDVAAVLQRAPGLVAEHGDPNSGGWVRVRARAAGDRGDVA